jgi:hypothetical protein
MLNAPVHASLSLMHFVDSRAAFAGSFAPRDLRSIVLSDSVRTW